MSISEDQDHSEHVNSDPADRRDILFRYYQDQWTHVRHHESLRSSLTLQVLATAGALVAGYISVDLHGDWIRPLLAFLVIVVGVGGYIAVSRIERAAEIHIDRARSARKAIGFLESHAKDGHLFPQLRPLYLGFNISVAVLGACLLLVAAFNA